MTLEHRFSDEWLTKVVGSMPGVPAGFVDGARRAKERYLASAVVRSGVAPAEIGAAVAAAYRIPFVEPDARAIDRTTIALVPDRVCRRYLVLPLRADTRRVEVAMANPLDIEAHREIEAVTGRRVAPRYCVPARLEELVFERHGPETVVFDLLKQVEASDVVALLSESDESRDPKSREEVRTPVIRLVNSLIAQAVRMRASDVHVEHEQEASHVRVRIDGALRKIMTLPRYLGAGPVVSRIKIMASLDVSDRRRPQDGQATLRVGERRIGLRVSTLPTVLGENAVLRILDAETSLRPLDTMFRADVVRRLRALTAREQGAFLVTGPTGSGKTTTLYAALRELVTGETNIVTIEDPIEYELRGINQVQVDDTHGRTFAAVLRSVLRQDPDVVLVGEIRDAETADVALRAANTGHLVFSTLHTNDTTATIERLADMGVDRPRISAGVIAITAQRLLRRLCARCRRPLGAREIPDRVRSAMHAHGLAVEAFAPTGCTECDWTGYHGRVALLEVLQVTPDVQEAIARQASPPELRRRAVDGGALHAMEFDALCHLSTGNVSIDDAASYLDAAVSRADAAGGEAPGAPSRAAERGPSTAPRRRVLVAEADAAARTMLRHVLAAEAYDVETADDGADALVRIAQAPPDLLIAALDLATVDGVALIRHVRTRLGLAALPIITSGDAADAARRGAALAAGACDFLSRPVRPGLASAIVAAALKRDGDFAAVTEIMRPPRPPDETARLADVQRTGLLDSLPEDRFDSVTRLAQRLFDVPIALVSLVDEDRQWFKSRAGLDTTETPRDDGFCAHAILGAEPFVVADAALDARFSTNALVVGEPRVRFYAGCPVTGPAGHRLGTLCIMDRRPRRMSDADVRSLRDLAAVVEKEIRASALRTMEA